MRSSSTKSQPGSLQERRRDDRVSGRWKASDYAIRSRPPGRFSIDMVDAGNDLWRIRLQIRESPP